MNRFRSLIGRRGRAEKVLLTVLTVGVVGSLAAFGVFSAFSSTSSNTGNSFTAGTVILGGADNATVGSSIFSVSNGTPSSTTQKCVVVSYSGTLPANVKLYRTVTGTPSGNQYITLTVTKGTGTASNCSDFTAAASNSSVFNNTLDQFTASDFSSGISLSNNAGTPSTTWGNGDSVTYKVTTSLADNNNAQGATSCTIALNCAAQNT